MNRAPLLLAAGLALGLAGCDIFDVNPEISIDEALAFNDEQTVNAILVGAYSELQTSDLQDQGTIFADLATETASHTGSFPTWTEVDAHLIPPNSVVVGDIWSNNYDLINIVNNLIRFTPDVEDDGFSQAERDRVVGQALALRAFAYHSLIRWYGVRGGAGVPIVTEPTVAVEDAIDVARNSYDEVYTQIINDYQQAEDLLDGNSAGIPTGYITVDAVRALLARTYLYAERYQEASDTADLVIPNYTLATLASVYEGLNSSESVWELQYNPDDTNSMSFYGYIAGGRYEYGPTPDFANSFSPADARRPYNIEIGSRSRPQVAKYFRVNTDDDHHFMVRLPELLFIKAEAAARAGDYDEAIELVNQVRARAYQEVDADGDGTADVSLEDFLYSADADDDGTDDVDTLDEALDIILNERRFELAFEGHRWHDLVRTGRAVSTLTNLEDEFRTRWPIPQDELDANQLLEQNPGY